MALGWKILIPTSLAWIMTVALAKTLRMNGAQPWTTVILYGAFLAGVLVVAMAWNAKRRRRLRTAYAPTSDALPPSAFPVPPLPNKEKTHA